MVIGFVLDDSLDSSDGVQQYVKTLASWLNNQGHEVHFLVGQSPESNLKNVHSLSRTVGVRFNRNKMRIPLPAKKADITRLLKEINFDVLHVQMPYSPLLAARVIDAAGPKTAVVGTFHILPYSSREQYLTKVLGSILKSSLIRFDSIASVSPAAQRFALSHFRSDSVVIPNAIAFDNFRRANSLKTDSQLTIVYLGRFVERKGAQHLLSALEFISVHDADNLKGIKVIFCGDGPLRLDAEVRATSLQKHGIDMQFKGFVSESEKANYLSAANIAVFPSTGGESFGIVLIEAMASGAEVVIGGNNPGYRSVLESDSRVLFDPKDTKSFADLLLDLIHNSKKRRVLHEWQQNIVRKYDINFVGPKILHFYEEAIAKRRSLNDNKNIV